jgi:hypothetical protein
MKTVLPSASALTIVSAASLIAVGSSSSLTVVSAASL